MKHISILVPIGHSSLSNIDGTHQIFTEVNKLLEAKGMPPAFNIQLVGLKPETPQRNGLFTIKPEVLISDVKKTDVIIIPAVHDDFDAAYEANKDFTPWIVEQYNNGAQLVSFCIAAFFLARTGLLKGRQCATHWRFVNEFRNKYPDINLVDDRIMTEDRGIYTSGGAYSYLNLVLYLIEKYVGREIAVLISKAFMVDIDRSSQSPFIIFEGQKAHEDEPIKKAQEFIEHNYTEKITVDQLAGMLALGRRSLERRFKRATCNTVTEYIQRVKMEAAKKSFENSRKNINEVMYSIGYSDVKAFRVVFKKVTGMTPVDYRNKYNKEIAA